MRGTWTVLVAVLLAVLVAFSAAPQAARAEEAGAEWDAEPKSPLVPHSPPTDEGEWHIEQGEMEVKAGAVPWAFVASYCFSNQGNDGVMQWKVEIEKANGGLIPIPTPGNNTPISHQTGFTLVLYDDQPSSFPAIWNLRNQPDVSCATLTDARRNNLPINIPFGMSSFMTEKFADHNSGHQWFVAVAGCSAPAADLPLRFKYEFKFSNNGKSAKSFELDMIPGPTAVYAVFMILGLALFGFSTIFRTMKEGLGIMRSHIHRLLAVSFVLLLCANISMWAWSGGHAGPSISALLFFQGLHHASIMWMMFFLVVSHLADRSFIERILGDVYMGLSLLYFIFWWVQSYEEYFPGVVGATVFSNGLSVTASIFRGINTIIFGYLFWQAYTAEKGPGANNMFGILVGTLFVVWHFVPMLALWSAYASIYSCNPASLLVNTWFTAIFDTVAMWLLVALSDVQWSKWWHSSVQGVAPSILAAVNPHVWGGMWEQNSSGARVGGYGHVGTAPSGIVVDDDSGAEYPQATGGNKSYGTL